MKVDCPHCGSGNFQVELIRAPFADGEGQQRLYAVACAHCNRVVGAIDSPDNADVLTRLDALEAMLRSIAERVGAPLPP
jgi:uncharacterized Zn finger protein